MVKIYTTITTKPDNFVVGLSMEKLLTRTVVRIAIITIAVVQVKLLIVGVEVAYHQVAI